MAIARLTKRTVDAVAVPTPRAARVFVWDEALKGFGLMVTGTGVRSYIIQYRIGGRGNSTKRATIGQHGSPWTAEQARTRAEELLEMVRRKVDPVEADRARLAAEREGRAAAERYAFGKVATAYLKSVDARKLRSAVDVRAVFDRDLSPFFADKPLPSINRTDVHDCIAAVAKRSQSAANKAHAWLSAMFTWAVDQARFGITSSPMFAISPPFAAGKRKRVLSDAELRRVWNGATALGDPFGALVKLLVLTGQRLREVAGMSWTELDLGKCIWRVPGDRTKNRHEHICPLSPQAVAVLNTTQPDTKMRTGFVLSTNGKVAVSGFSRAKQRLDAVLLKTEAKRSAEAGTEPVELPAWTFHDLRRTLATGLQAQGFPVEHVEAVLNHVSGKRGGIVAVYQIHEYLPEKVKALGAWGRHVATISDPDGQISNVIPIASRA